MNAPTSKSDLFWKITVVVLLLIVAGQLYLQRSAARPETPAGQPETLTMSPPPKPIVPPPSPGATHGINPYDQPQIRSGADMFQEMQRIAEQMMQEMDRDMPMHMFGSLPAGNRPLAYGGPMLKITPENYIVKMEMPGLDKANISATIKDDVLTITGKQESEQTQTKSDGKSHTSSTSHFQTALYLPGPVKSEQMKIDYQGHELTIIIPRK